MHPDRSAFTPALQIVAHLRMCGHFLNYKMGDKSGQRRLLAMLHHHGEAPQRELQSLLQLSSGSMSELVAKVQADGLVEKIRSTTDRRQMDLRLTEKGTQTAIRLRKHYEERVEQLLGCFDDAEKAQLLSLLDRLGEHIGNLAFPCGCCRSAPDFAEAPCSNENKTAL
ncbi:MAG: MarR family transcriptional regulator [Christensenellaceae bacterium]|nr:MarR family transcriptional regulator [Christensenellaceae bacterium]